MLFPYTVETTLYQTCATISLSPVVNAPVILDRYKPSFTELANGADTTPPFMKKLVLAVAWYSDCG